MLQAESPSRCFDSTSRLSKSLASAMGTGAIPKRRASMESPGVSPSEEYLRPSDLRSTPCSRYASMPPRERHGRLGPIGKADISKWTGLKEQVLSGVLDMPHGVSGEDGQLQWTVRNLFVSPRWCTRVLAPSASRGSAPFGASSRLLLFQFTPDTWRYKSQLPTWCSVRSSKATTATTDEDQYSARGNATLVTDIIACTKCKP